MQAEKVMRIPALTGTVGKAPVQGNTPVGKSESLSRLRQGDCRASSVSIPAMA